MSLKFNDNATSIIWPLPTIEPTLYRGFRSYSLLFRLPIQLPECSSMFLCIVGRLVCCVRLQLTGAASERKWPIDRLIANGDPDFWAMPCPRPVWAVVQRMRLLAATIRAPDAEGNQPWQRLLWVPRSFYLSTSPLPLLLSQNLPRRSRDRRSLSWRVVIPISRSSFRIAAST